MPSRPLPDVAGTYLARIVASFEGLPDDTLLAFHCTPAPSTGAADIAQAQAVGDAIGIRWATFAATGLHNSYRATEVQTYPLHTPTHPAVLSATGAAGGLSGQISAAPLAILIKHEIVRRGKGSQGRTFVQPFTSGMISADGKTIDDTTKASYQSLWNAFILAVETDVTTATGLVTTFGQLSKIPPGAFYPANASLVEAQLSTQRRRTRRSSS